MERWGVTLALPLIARPEAEEAPDPAFELLFRILRKRAAHQREYIRRRSLVANRSALDCIEQWIRHEIFFVGLMTFGGTQLRAGRQAIDRGKRRESRLHRAQPLAN